MVPRSQPGKVANLHLYLTFSTTLVSSWASSTLLNFYYILNPSLKVPPKYVQCSLTLQLKPSLIASILPTWATVTFSCLVCLSKPWTHCSMFRTQLPEFLPTHINLTLTCWSLAMMTAKLPVEFRISYRIHLLIYKSQHAFAPQHFSDLLF